jgi:hypothetical protein
LFLFCFNNINKQEGDCDGDQENLTKSLHFFIVSKLGKTVDSKGVAVAKGMAYLILGLKVVLSSWLTKNFRSISVRKPSELLSGF